MNEIVVYTQVSLGNCLEGFTLRVILLGLLRLSLMILIMDLQLKQ